MLGDAIDSLDQAAFELRDGADRELIHRVEAIMLYVRTLLDDQRWENPSDGTSGS